MWVELRMVTRLPDNMGPLNREARKVMLREIRKKDPNISEVIVREVPAGHKLKQFESVD